MKSILLVIAIILLPLALQAAPQITVESPTAVVIDGATAGTVADSIANHPALASAIQTALVKWAKKIQDAKSASEQKATEVQATIESVAARAKKAVADGNTAALEEVLKEAEAPKKSRDLEALDKQIAELQAKRAALEAEEIKAADIKQ